MLSPGAAWPLRRGGRGRQPIDEESGNKLALSAFVLERTVSGPCEHGARVASVLRTKDTAPRSPG
eukprot:gene435-3877_t